MNFHIDTEVISIVILIVILLESKKKLDKAKDSSRRFISCVVITILFAVIKVICFAAMVVSAPAAINSICRALYCELLVLPEVSWLCYSTAVVYENDRKGRRPATIAAKFGYILYTAFALTNVRTGMIFSSDERLTLRNGPLSYVPEAVCVLYALAVLLMLFVNRKRLLEKGMVPDLSLFPLITIAGMLLRLRMPGWDMEVPCYMVAVFIAYMFIQNRTNEKILNKLTVAADTDQLTGLLNRAAAERYCDQVFESKKDEQCAILIIDLDDFKAVNDTLGHPAGDKALQLAAEALKKSFCGSGIVARIGGDEFAVLLTGIIDRPMLDHTMEETVKNFSRLTFSTNVSDRMLLRCSIGAAYGSICETDRETLYHQADEALYHVKKCGKSGYKTYDCNSGITSADSQDDKIRLI